MAAYLKNLHLKSTNSVNKNKSSVKYVVTDIFVSPENSS